MNISQSIILSSPTRARAASQPSTFISEPVMKLDFSEVRKTTAPSTSLGLPSVLLCLCHVELVLSFSKISVLHKSCLVKFH